MKGENKKFILLFIISLIFLIISVLTSYLASYYIKKVFVNPPIAKDLLWEKLPYYPVMMLSEIFLLLSVVYGSIWAFKNNKNLIPYTILLISIFHILRAGLIILTPLGFPYEYDGFIHQKRIFNYGAFPSGHLSVPYLIFMVSKKKIPLLLTFLVGLTLLISRGHYSIDLVGTLLLSYPVFKFSEKYIRKYFEYKNEAETIYNNNNFE